jgi:hypothetical protein
MRLICTVKNNSGGPCFHYHLYHEKNSLREKDARWHHPLPLNRKHLPEGNSVSFGDYFHAVRSFLMQEDCKGLREGISDLSGRNISAGDLGDIHIFLEKHGEFYHPACVKSRGHAFVVNGALSPAGKKNICREYILLEYLQKSLSASFLPKVWSLGRGKCPDGTALPMFLGEWFGDFHEFHIAADPSPALSAGKKKQRISVWAPESHYYLNPAQQDELYRQVAMILTVCYDTESFRHIWPWHHAAGDFVLNLSGGSPEVKLITVRQYEPVIRLAPEEAGESDLLQALLLFLISLSVHTRLDRVEGTGELIWAEDAAVRPTLEGFFKGLRQKKPPYSDPFPSFFLAFLRQLPKDSREENAAAVAANLPPASPESEIVRKNLKTHIKTLFQTVNEGIDL